MNSNTWPIILAMYWHTYAICRTCEKKKSARGQVFLFISVFQQVFKEVVLRAFLVSVAVFTGGLRSALIRSVLSQTVSRQPLTAEGRVRSQAYPLWCLWWTEWHWDRFCLRVHLLSTVSVIPPILNTLSFIYHCRNTSLAIDSVVK